MALLQTGESFLILLDGRLQLLDVLGSSFSKGGLRLAIALLSLFGGGIDLARGVSVGQRQRATTHEDYRLASTFAFLRLCGFV